MKNRLPRVSFVGCRVRVAEHEALTAAANEQGSTVSDLFRRALQPLIDQGFELLNHAK